ncbi:site-2 protease family protein [Mycobacterium cookii]|uniref:Putative zinc metalloprotease Rip2 n=1 Tax=Mycobacterium cookii TaxID=1775 RepID=A0A7I7L1T3_9MYCO|nr:site-2 protease family protein [Mycobacterium cookii]MCV7333247.1 site-2 protease family protein [Mycobacterium cookii]BBX47738.1 putative zinc metalloprotease Rip2 [Mycobacterium cookii]
MSALESHRSVRPSPIFLAIVGLTAFGGTLAYLDGADSKTMAYVSVFVFVIAGWVVSLCLHEFGHAFTAWRFGDRNVEVRGYLDLDPRRYTHPLLSLVVPVVITALGGIGLPGAAVYVQTSFMTAKQRTLVSLAGPAANITLAVVLLGLTELFFDLKHLVFWSGVAFLGFLQVTAALLNLLPIPGLDGYNALEPHLSPETQRALDQFKPYGFMILIFLIFARPVNQAFFGFIGWLFELTGVPTVPVSLGMQLIQIWHAF